MFGWNDKPTRAEARHTIGGDNPARVVTVGYGQYEVTIPNDPEADVTYRKPYGVTGDPRQTFPNMEVRDGEMRIPLEDIVSSILARVDPTEIAVALWANEEVRNEFMDAMVTRYSERNIGDADRRKFLTGVKEAVHSKALDRFGGKAAELEYQFGRKWFFYHQVNQINDWLREGEYKDRDGNTLQLRHEDADAVFKISGASWHEAREHWRQEALRLFPAQGIEARSGETGTGSTEGESPVGKADAPLSGSSSASTEGEG